MTARYSLAGRAAALRRGSPTHGCAAVRRIPQSFAGTGRRRTLRRCVRNTPRSPAWCRACCGLCDATRGKARDRPLEDGRMWPLQRGRVRRARLVRRRARSVRLASHERAPSSIATTIRSEHHQESAPTHEGGQRWTRRASELKNHDDGVSRLASLRPRGGAPRIAGCPRSAFRSGRRPPNPLSPSDSLPPSAGARPS